MFRYREDSQRHSGEDYCGLRSMHPLMQIKLDDILPSLPELSGPDHCSLHTCPRQTAFLTDLETDDNGTTITVVLLYHSHSTLLIPHYINSPLHGPSRVLQCANTTIRSPTFCMSLSFGSIETLELVDIYTQNI